MHFTEQKLSRSFRDMTLVLRQEWSKHRVTDYAAKLDDLLATYNAHERVILRDLFGAARSFYENITAELVIAA